jgi:hypothetical protein
MLIKLENEVQLYLASDGSTNFLVFQLLGVDRQVTQAITTRSIT